jgi:beta-phosphoglucomutase-like phosphatase (HAD superfamily)
MDGVLVDTGEFHFQAWSQVLPDYGLEMRRELFQATFGMNNAGVVSTLLGRRPDPELLDELGERKEQLFRQVVRGHAANIDVLVDELELRAYFAAIATGYDLPGKPDPTLFLKAARQIDVPPERCVVVEDAVAGVEAAKRAGMKCIAVTTSNPAQALDEADVVVERLDELPLDTFRQLLGGIEE